MDPAELRVVVNAALESNISRSGRQDQIAERPERHEIGLTAFREVRKIAPINGSVIPDGHREIFPRSSRNILAFYPLETSGRPKGRPPHRSLYEYAPMNLAVRKVAPI